MLIKELRENYLLIADKLEEIYLAGGYTYKQLGKEIRVAWKSIYVLIKYKRMIQIKNLYKINEYLEKLERNKAKELDKLEKSFNRKE